MRDGSDVESEWPLLNALLNTAGGATWVSLHHGGGVGMLEAKHLGIDLLVPTGGITALLGPNGAGKTSTLMAIVGRVAVFGGRILLEGQDITTMPPAERTERRAPTRGLDVRRRSANAGHRPRLEGPTPAAIDRRTVTGADARRRAPEI